MLAIRVDATSPPIRPRREASGLLIDVDPVEAEWTLDVLEELFDFYTCSLEGSRNCVGSLTRRFDVQASPR